MKNISILLFLGIFTLQGTTPKKQYKALSEARRAYDKRGELHLASREEHDTALDTMLEGIHEQRLLFDQYPESTQKVEAIENWSIYYLVLYKQKTVVGRRESPYSMPSNSSSDNE